MSSDERLTLIVRAPDSGNVPSKFLARLARVRSIVPNARCNALEAEVNLRCLTVRSFACFSSDLSRRKWQCGAVVEQISPVETSRDS